MVLTLSLGVVMKKLVLMFILLLLSVQTYAALPMYGYEFGPVVAKEPISDGGSGGGHHPGDKPGKKLFK